MAQATIKIGGMSCQHCVASVGKAITSVNGVQKVDISIGNAYIEYDESKARLDEIEAAIEKEGYKVIKQ
ncbi:MAG: heavy-metal-associated domain-containing protein [Syntrophorhabdaceae bacterium]|jgi:copper chaperone|nr:heavy-metal-associated domain-containing protein [Syntrophorhabdales bacterium]MBP9561225.1 heavy-metal-associated domain-containing protein [Syntrophorhabdaceae bacterium]